MNLPIIQIVVLLGFLTFANAQVAPPPDVPAKIKAPDGEQLLLTAHASGFQIYTCQPGTDGKSAWTLKAPEAELKDKGDVVIGHHYAGPTWKHNDGSEITGKLVSKVDAPEADAIPWLLLSVASHSGSGVLEHVTSVQRIHTKGGQPPAAASCTSSNLNAASKSPYSADYYFYGPAR